MLRFRCTKCGEERDEDDFHRDRRSKTGRSYRCKLCERRDHAALYRGSTAYRVRNMLSNARQRAARACVPFDLTPTDITVPEFCPVFGVPFSILQRGYHDYSPSLDRIIPALGYIPGNIIVVSLRANRIKNDATIEELMAVSAFYTDITK